MDGNLKAGMAMADCNLQGDGSRPCFATVIAGEFTGEEVCILVKYTDGFCICDMGNEKPMEVISIGNLRPWIPVRNLYAWS